MQYCHDQVRMYRADFVSMQSVILPFHRVFQENYVYVEFDLSISYLCTQNIHIVCVAMVACHNVEEL